MIKDLKNKIEKSDTIILMCHLVPDHDSVGSTNAFKKMLALNYPEKEVRIYAQNSSYFEQFSPNIKYDENKKFENCLYIALDCANKERLSWNELEENDYVIKIDHHPPVQNFGDLNLVDIKKSSTCEYLWDIFKEMNVKVNKDICTLLYLGIVGDTGRFLFKNTTQNTYKVVSEMFEYGLDPKNDIYPYIYSISIKDIKVKSKILKQLLVIKKFGVVLLTQNILEELNLNVLDVSKFTNQIGNISELDVWIIIVQEEDYYKCSIRSKTKVINDIAQNFGGGGHMYASGVKLESIDNIFELINKLINRTNESNECISCSCCEFVKNTLKCK